MVGASLPGVRLTPLVVRPGDFIDLESACPRISIGRSSPAPWVADARRRSLAATELAAPHFVLLPDPFSCPAETLIGELDRLFPASVKVGGIASAARQPGGNLLWAGGEPVHGGAVALALEGDLAVDTIVAQGLPADRAADVRDHGPRPVGPGARRPAPARSPARALRGRVAARSRAVPRLALRRRGDAGRGERVRPRRLPRPQPDPDRRRERRPHRRRRRARRQRGAVPSARRADLDRGPAITTCAINRPAARRPERCSSRASVAVASSTALPITTASDSPRATARCRWRASSATARSARCTAAPSCTATRPRSDCSARRRGRSPSARSARDLIALDPRHDRDSAAPFCSGGRDGEGDRAVGCFGFPCSLMAGLALGASEPRREPLIGEADVYGSYVLLSAAKVKIGEAAEVDGNIHSNDSIELRKNSWVRGDVSAVKEVKNGGGTVTGRVTQRAAAVALPALPDKNAIRAQANRVLTGPVKLVEPVVDDVLYVNGAVTIQGVARGTGTLIVTGALTVAPASSTGGGSDGAASRSRAPPVDPRLRRRHPSGALGAAREPAGEGPRRRRRVGDLRWLSRCRSRSRARAWLPGRDSWHRPTPPRRRSRSSAHPIRSSPSSRPSI